MDRIIISPHHVHSLNDLAYYLVERFGEAIGGGLVPALIFILPFVFFARSRKTIIVAGMVGSQLLPFLSLLTAMSSKPCSTLFCSMHPADIFVSILMFLAVGAGTGAIISLIVWKGKKRTEDSWQATPSPIPPVTAPKRATPLGMTVMGFARQIPGLWFPPKVPPVTTSSKPQKRAGPLGMTLMIIGGVLSLVLIPAFVEEGSDYLENRRLQRAVEGLARDMNARLPIVDARGVTTVQAWASGNTLSAKSRSPINRADLTPAQLASGKAQGRANVQAQMCTEVRSQLYSGFRLHYYYVDINDAPLYDFVIDHRSCQGQYRKSPPPVSASAPQETEDPLSFLDDPPK